MQTSLSGTEPPGHAAGPSDAAEAGRPAGANFLIQFTITFAAVALILSLAAGFALTGFLSRDIRSKTLDDVTAEISEVTAPQVVRNLGTTDLEQPLDPAAFASFDQFVRGNLLSPRTVRVNIWNPSGQMVYSTYPSLLNSGLANDQLEPVLGGQSVAEVEGGAEERQERAGLEDVGDVMEVYVPLYVEGSSEPFGVLEVYRDFTPIASHIRDVQKSVFISIAAALGALYLALLLLVRRGSNTIRRQQADIQSRTDELRVSYESIVAALCAALDLRDNVTHGHAQRVSQLASVVAWQMGLRKEQVRQIEKAAILHDIGKIGVADAVLSKPGPLDEVEWAEMRRHPELGYQILTGIDFLMDVAEIVYAHHERFDGSGYPRGLKAEEIPLGARIFGVVDAYDAMTSHRPYRKPMPVGKAVAEIVANSGTQFDPVVVEAFLEAERKGLLNGNQHDDEEHDLVTARPARG